jgi:hypothetical protein
MSLTTLSNDSFSSSSITTTIVDTLIVTNSASYFNTVSYGKLPIDNTLESISDFFKKNGLAIPDLWNNQINTQATPVMNSANQGTSTSISSDGNTIAVGAPTSNQIWVYNRTDGYLWTQTQLLFATNPVGNANQGYSVALSGDAKVLVVGGPNNNSGQGAFWVFKYKNVWKQVAGPIVSVSGGLQQGTMAAVSYNGDTIAVGSLTSVSMYTFNVVNNVCTYITTVTYSSITSIALSSNGNDLAVLSSDTEQIHVYIKSGGSWILQQDITSFASNVYNVCINADTIILTTRYGSAWGFDDYYRTAGVWNGPVSNIFFPLTTVSYSIFPCSLTADAGKVYVGLGGTTFYDSNLNILTSGGFIVYRKEGPFWIFEYKIISSSPSITISCGSSIGASDENTMVVGSPDYNSTQGSFAVYSTFKRSKNITNTNIIPPDQTNRDTILNILKVRNLYVTDAISFFGSDLINQQFIEPTMDSIYNFLSVYNLTYPIKWILLQDPIVGEPANLGPIQNQGYSVAISSDGTTFIEGSPLAEGFWVFIRSGSTWIQQGVLMTGTGATGLAKQGTSICLSDDGNTAVSGGPNDNSDVGAVWVFTRSGVTWSQTNMLVGMGYTGFPKQGSAVCISAVGDVIAVGGPGNNSNVGAVWIWVYNVGWLQDEIIIPPVGVGSDGEFGSSLSISGDGNILVVGSTGFVSLYKKNSNYVFQTNINLGVDYIPSVSLSFDGTALAVGICGDSNVNDINNVGAESNYVVVYNMIQSSWILRSGKLVGEDITPNSCLGFSISMSGDGNLIMAGAFMNNNSGCVVPYINGPNGWEQQSVQITTFEGYASQGYSVALSRDSRLVVFGGTYYNNVDNNNGAVWMFGSI